MNRGPFFWWSRWMKSNAFLRTPQQSSPQTNSRSRWNRRICSFCPRMNWERESVRREDRTAHGSRCSPPIVKNTRFWCSSTQGRTVLFAPSASHLLKFQQRPDLNSLLGQKRRWLLGWSTFHVRSTEWIYWIKCVRDVLLVLSQPCSRRGLSVRISETSSGSGKKRGETVVLCASCGYQRGDRASTHVGEGADPAASPLPNTTCTELVVLRV